LFELFIFGIEINEYAEYLGMDLVKDKKYVSIAKEGLKASIPEDWKSCQDRTG